MGFNGKQQSHSVIGFEFSKEETALRAPAFQCNTTTPSDGNFANYTNVGNCSCAACDLACPAPSVNAEVGFFDGFDGALVAIVYGALILFSVLFQVIRKKFFGGADQKASGSGDEDEIDVQNDDPSNPYLAMGGAKARKDNKINDSGISS